MSPQWLAYSKDSPPELITKPMQKLVEVLADKQALIAGAGSGKNHNQPRPTGLFYHRSVRR
jgi:hypothetical protein